MRVQVNDFLASSPSLFPSVPRGSSRISKVRRWDKKKGKKLRKKINKQKKRYIRAPRAREYCDRVPRLRPTDRFSLGFGLLHAMTLGKVSILCNLWKDILLNTFARIEVNFGKRKKRSFLVRDVFPGKLQIVIDNFDEYYVLQYLRRHFE